MTPDQTRAMLQRLAHAFSVESPSDAAVHVWTEETSHIGVDLARTAASRLIREGERFPTIAAFNKAVAVDRERLAVENRSHRDRDNPCPECDGDQWIENTDRRTVRPCPRCLPRADARLDDVGWRKGDGYPPHPTSSVR